MSGNDGKAAAAPRAVGWRELAAVAAALLLLSVAFTWPLVRHFSSDVLYTHRAHPGYERVPIAQGDHLQLLYLFWLLGDSVSEGRTPLTDPYEFRDGSPPAFFFQPSLLPLLTFLLSPLGLIPAYNLLTLLSFVGAGLATHLVLRLEIDDRWAAFAGALVVALMPYRVAQVAGHANGFLVFLVPLYLYFFERSLRARRWAGWAVAAGATFFFAGAMEFHIAYYLVLLLGLYLPFRFLAPPAGWLVSHEPQPRDPTGFLPPLLAALGGAGAGIAFYHAADSVHHFNRPAGWLVTAAVAASATLCAWRLLCHFAERHVAPPVTDLRRTLALPFAPLILLALAPLGVRLGIPYLGKASVAAALAIAAALALPAARLGARARLLPQAGKLFTDRARRYLLNVAFIGGTLAYLLLVRKLIFKSSVAGGGRRFTEVAAFSPSFTDLFTAASMSAERAVYIGVVAAALALAGIWAVHRIDDPGRRARIAFFAGAGIVGLLLAIGPHLDLFPAYHVLYRSLPLFNLPRVSGRILVVAGVGLATLVALGFAALRQRAGRRAGALTGALLALMIADYLPRHPPGLTTLPSAHPVYERLARERNAGETILELPIWPGDTAWTSIYLWFVTRYRNPLVNGYSPATPRAYVERTFRPLYPLDFGEMRRPQYDLLRRLGVRFIVFHEEAYPDKISAFPFGVTAENLRTSKYLETLEYSPPLWLFRLRPEPPPDENPVAGAISPVGSLWEAERWGAGRGTRVEDPLASGGAVVSFPAGISGVLNRPFPARVYPAGRYRAQARFLTERAGAAPGMRLEVLLGSPGRLLVSSASPAGSDRGGVLDVEVGFTLDAPGQVFLQLTSDGSAPVRGDYALVRFADAPEPQLSIEIEDLWHIGTPLADPAASGGRAVEMIPDYHPRDFAFSGPDRVIPAGAWAARLRLRPLAPGDDDGDDRFEVSLSNVERPLAAVGLEGAAVPDGYREIELQFYLERPAPLRFRVFFSGRRHLALDRIAVTPAPANR